MYRSKRLSTDGIPGCPLRTCGMDSTPAVFSPAGGDPSARPRAKSGKFEMRRDVISRHPCLLASQMKAPRVGTEVGRSAPAMRASRFFSGSLLRLVLLDQSRLPGQVLRPILTRTAPRPRGGARTPVARRIIGEALELHEGRMARPTSLRVDRNTTRSQKASARKTSPHHPLQLLLRHRGIDLGVRASPTVHHHSPRGRSPPASARLVQGGPDASACPGFDVR